MLHYNQHSRCEEEHEAYLYSAFNLTKPFSTPWLTDANSFFLYHGLYQSNWWHTQRDENLKTQLAHNLFGERMEIINRLLGTDVKNYFRFCPLCLAEGSIRPQISNVRGIKDYITCTSCGAKWHIGIGKYSWNAGRVQWAELITDGIDKKGGSLLGKREKPEFWQHMALKGIREIPQVKEEQTPAIIKEKEVIREIVKVRCRHCGTLYVETLDKCPNCGASLWLIVHVMMS